MGARSVVRRREWYRLTLRNPQVREEFLSAFGDALGVMARLEEVQKELETATDDMERMGSLLDELNDLQKKADKANVYSLRRVGAALRVCAALTRIAAARLTR